MNASDPSSAAPRPADAHAWGWADTVSLALILVGSGVRIYQWALARSLWLDESYLAVNIVERSFGALHHPLEYGQSAPYLFLVLTKCLVSVLGADERVLRLLPLAASILSLWVFWRLARACFPGWVVPVVVAIFTLSRRPLLYAHELKQYSVEIFVTTLLAWLAVRVFRHPETPRRHFIVLFVAGSLAVFAMHPAPFVLAGLALAALWARRLGRLSLPYRWILLASGAWLTLAAVNYLVVIRPVYSDPVVARFWPFAYPRLPWSVAGLRSWFVLINEYLAYLGYAHVFKILVVGAVAAGAWVAFRTRRFVSFAAVLTIGAYWLAALAGKAPFHGRLILFLFPPLVLLVGQGLDSLTGRVHRLVLALAAAGLLIPTFVKLPDAVRFVTREDLRGPITYLARARAAGEPVYVEYWAQPAFRFYRRTLRLSALAPPRVVFGGEHRLYGPPSRAGAAPTVSPDIPRIVAELAPLVSHPRFWFLAAHFEGTNEDLLRRIHASYGLTPVSTFRAEGCSLYCFETAPASAARNQ